MNKRKEKEKTSLGLFLKEKKYYALFCFVIIALTYWPKIVFENYSIDTEDFIANGKETGFMQWLSIGRYGLFLMKQFITGYDLNIRVANVVTYTILCVIVIYLGYIFFQVCGGLSASELSVIPLLFSTSAILLEQLNFVLQSVEVAFSYLLIFLSVHLIYLSAERKNSKYLIGSVLFCVMGFSVYPSNYVAFVAFSIMVILCLLINMEQLSFTEYLIFISPYVLVFVVSLILNNLLFQLFLTLYDAHKIDYVESGIIWGKKPIWKIFEGMGTELEKIYLFPDNVYYTYALPLGIILTILLLLTRKKNRLWLMLSALGLLLVSNANIIVLGQIGPVRTLAPIIPLVTAFLFLFVSHRISKWPVKVAVFCFAIFFGVIQMKQTSHFGIQENNKFQEEVAYVHQLTDKLKNQGITDLSSYKLVALGAKHFPVEDEDYQGDVLGKSFFEWDHGSRIGSSGRIGGFFNALGYKVQKIDSKDYQKAQQNVQEQPMQVDDVRVVDDLIIIKVSG